jgi:hypothetical protein
VINWRELEERAIVVTDESNRILTREELERNEFIEELDVPGLRRRVASALIRIGEKIDPSIVATDDEAA